MTNIDELEIMLENYSKKVDFAGGDGEVERISLNFAYEMTLIIPQFIEKYRKMEHKLDDKISYIKYLDMEYHKLYKKINGV